MKPISIRFKCFGPYMAEQFIDFTKLEKSGLFLICGETGAGKTTILDAMCIALYGRSSGGIRGELSEMRCKLAGKDDVTNVEFIFQNGDKTYQFSRSLHVGLKNERDSHQCAELVDGQWVPIFENPKKTNVNAKAEEIIGLTYDQFRQVIILPQGQFEKLLTADSKDKEAILTSLFHTERLDWVVEELYGRVKKRDDDLKEEWKGIELQLSQHGCGTLEELKEQAEREAEDLIALRGQLEAANKAAEEKKEVHKQALLEDSMFEELTKKEQELSGLLTRQADIAQDEELLRQTEDAKNLHLVHLAYTTAQDAVETQKGKMKDAQDELAEAEDEAREAEERYRAHEDGKEADGQRKNRVVLLENARQAYQKMADHKKQLENCTKALKDAEESERKAVQAFERADEMWQRALEEQKKARQAHQEAQDAYLRGIGGTLAAHLQPGRPCPVCGNVEHPNPAKMAEGHITDSELDERSEAVNRANDAEVKTREARSAAEKEREAAKDQLARAKQAETEARAQFEQGKSGMISGINTEEELDRELEVLKKQTEDYAQRGVLLRNELDENQQKRASVEGALKQRSEELKDIKADYREKQEGWLAALKASRFEDEAQFLAARMDEETQQQKKQACEQFRVDLGVAQNAVDQKREELKGKVRPNMEEIGAALNKATDEVKRLHADCRLKEESVGKLDRDCKDLDKRQKEHDKARAAVDADLEFANRLRGRSGVSLQRYVLGVKLSAITVAANRLLETVYGGRYRLYRTDDVAGRTQKAGLELEVYDTAQNQRRNVTTLSGGEKFLVALSLAIGLSTVVQASGGGIHMEAMFVDEGFGSLDSNAVDDALDILQGIQRNAGMVVGIISHVPRLEETILTKLEVKKGDAGSTIRVRC